LRTRSSEETRPAIVTAEQISTQETETMGYLFFYGFLCSLPIIFETISFVQNVSTYGFENEAGTWWATPLPFTFCPSSIVVSSCGGKGVGAR
jgi:hypothetical protein